MTTKTLLVYRKKNKKGNWVKRYSLTENPALGELTDETAYRLIADTGKVLTDGTQQVSCIDTKTPENFTEIDEPQPETTNEQESNQ